MLDFSKLSLARFFLIASFLILLTGMVVIGLWVGGQIEARVINRTGSLTAIYVDSLVGHHLPPFAQSAQLDPDEQEPLDMLFNNTELRDEIVDFKLWDPNGHIVYSTDKRLIGSGLPINPELAAAFDGQVSTEIVTSSATTPDSSGSSQPVRLMKTYAPIHTNGMYMDSTGAIREGALGPLNSPSAPANQPYKIIAAAEFDQTTADLDREVSAAQLSSWVVVGVATLLMYSLLAGLVGRASNIISRQHRELQEQVQQLTALVEQNKHLNSRVHRAAARSTALNEQFLHRLSGYLHDGPCQDLGLALLRIESFAGSQAVRHSRANGRHTNDASAQSGNEDYRTIQTALQSALSELRTISTGLWLPALEPLTPREVAERAIRNYESKTDVNVTLSIDELPAEAPLPVKITLYRVLQEALMNGFLHASGAEQRVRVWADDGKLNAEVTDTGAGFDTRKVMQNGHLGLPGMRERVELLGGAFEVKSAPGRGTVVETRLPLTLPEDDNG